MYFGRSSSGACPDRGPIMRRIKREFGVEHGSVRRVDELPRRVGRSHQDVLAVSDTHLPKTFFFVP